MRIGEMLLVCLHIQIKQFNSSSTKFILREALKPNKNIFI